MRESPYCDGLRLFLLLQWHKIRPSPTARYPEWIVPALISIKADKSKTCKVTFPLQGQGYCRSTSDGDIKASNDDCRAGLYVSYVALKRNCAARSWCARRGIGAPWGRTGGAAKIAAQSIAHADFRRSRLSWLTGLEAGSLASCDPQPSQRLVVGCRRCLVFLPGADRRSTRLVPHKLGAAPA